MFKNGIAVGVENNIIHSLNKNEVSLPTTILEKLKNRDKVILLGDQVSDLNMVDKKNHNLVVSVGFLTSKEQSKTMTSNYDIVCEENDGYDKLKEILFWLNNYN